MSPLSGGRDSVGYGVQLMDNRILVNILGEIEGQIEVFGVW